MARRLTILAFAPMFILALGAEAGAKSKAARAKPAEAPAPAQPAEEPTPAQPTEVAAPPAEPPAQPETEPATNDEGPAAAKSTPPPGPANAPQFGVGVHARMVSLPSTFLGAFFKASRPLLSYGVGIDGFRRKRDTENPNRFSEISLGVSYQDMSPPDGNWLGNGHNPAIDTTWVQFKNFAFWTIDLSYIERQYFNEFFGIHYGAGVGLTIIQGDVLRTSSIGCTDQNLGTCRPRVCTGGVCTEDELRATENGQPQTDSPLTPHRYREGAVWPAAPSVTLMTGLDFRVPQTPGLEFRIDAGFFDFFVIFVGGSVAYVF